MRLYGNTIILATAPVAVAEIVANEPNHAATTLSGIVDLLSAWNCRPSFCIDVVDLLQGNRTPGRKLEPLLAQLASEHAPLVLELWDLHHAKQLLLSSPRLSQRPRR